MDVQSERLADGNLRITITMTEAELDVELQIMEQLDNQPGQPRQNTDEAESLRKKSYCCTCPGEDRNNTNQHTIRASNSWSAGLKCAKECTGPFSLRKGACT